MNCAEVFKKRSKLKVWFDSRFCPLNVSLVSLAAVFVSSHETKTASKEIKCEFNLLKFFSGTCFPFSTIPCDQGTKATCSSFKRLLFYVIRLLSWMKSTGCLLPCGALQDSGNFRLRKWSFFKAFSVLILAFFVVFFYFSSWYSILINIWTVLWIYYSVRFSVLSKQNLDPWKDGLLWYSLAVLRFQTCHNSLNVLHTIRMLRVESMKSVLTDTDSKVCTFRSLWMCPIFSCTVQEFSPCPVTLHPPYFSIKLTKGAIPRLLIAAVFTQEL